MSAGIRSLTVSCTWIAQFLLNLVVGLIYVDNHVLPCCSCHLKFNTLVLRSRVSRLLLNSRATRVSHSYKPTADLMVYGICMNTIYAVVYSCWAIRWDGVHIYFHLTHGRSTAWGCTFQRGSNYPQPKCMAHDLVIYVVSCYALFLHTTIAFTVFFFLLFFQVKEICCPRVMGDLTKLVDDHKWLFLCSTARAGVLEFGVLP